MKPINLAGQRFGRLEVVSRAGVDKHRYATWLCVCDCGKQVVARGRHLRIGDVRSCGCLRDETRLRVGALTKHGHYTQGVASPTYHSWASMKARCNTPRNPDFHRYGGRGITICASWESSFAAFLADMGERPEGKTLDRINNDGNYEPGNCRWATASEQARNRHPRKAADYLERKGTG